MTDDPKRAIPTDAALRALAERCIVRGTDQSLTIATAESCTGGLVAHMLTEIPGASTVFQGGWVVYSNQRKITDMGVDAALLQEAGAVSRPVVERMAAAARDEANTTFGIATSGIAGPTGGSEDKPIGLVWLGLAGPGWVYAEGYRDDLDGVDRSAHKRAFACRILEMLAAAIEAHPERPELPLG